MKHVTASIQRLVHAQLPATVSTQPATAANAVTFTDGEKLLLGVALLLIALLVLSKGGGGGT